MGTEQSDRGTRAGRGRRARFAFGAAALGACAFMVTAEALAEDTPELAEIVVSAQKRAQSSQDVGVTMDALAGSQLQQFGIVSAPELAKVTPGMNVAGSYAGQSLVFSIRGVTQQDYSAHTESPVAVYMDDAYMATNNAAGIGLFDIDHVEVLKGPQGTLFGRNATGGLVSIVSRKPSDTPDGHVDVSYGRYDEVRVEAAAGGPLSENVAGRIAGVYHSNGNYIENLSPVGGDLGRTTDYAFRGQLQVKAADKVKVLLTGYGTRSRSSWGPYFSLSTRNVKDAAGNVVNSIVVDAPTGLGTLPSPDPGKVLDANWAQSSGDYNNMYGATAKVTWDFGPELTSVTDYKHTDWRLQLDDDASPASLLNSDNVSSVKQFSQELRLYQDVGGFRWYSGLYYLHIKADVDDGQTVFPFGVRVDSFAREKTDSSSVFGQAEYDIAPKITLVGGARVTREKKVFDYNAEAFTLLGVDAGAARTPYHGTSEDTLITAKAQVEFRPRDGVLVYAGWNRGAKAGNFNAPFAGGTSYPDSAIPYKPEVLNAFEIGSKTTIFGGTTRLNGAVFYYDYSNYQAFKFIDLSTQVTNNPATVYGAEVSILTKPVSQLTLSAGASYTDDAVKNVSVSALSLTRTAPFTSKWKGTALARYEWSFAAGTLAAQADLEYTGANYFGLTNFDATRVGGYTLTNARLSWRAAKSGWEFALFGSNIADRVYKTVGYDLTGLCNCTQVGYGKPRWYGVSASYQFQ